MDKEQRRNSPGERVAKKLKNTLLTCHPFGFTSQAENPAFCLLYIIFSEYLYHTPDSTDDHFCKHSFCLYYLFIARQTLNVNVVSHYAS